MANLYRWPSNWIIKWVLTLPIRIILFPILMYQVYGVALFLDQRFWILSPPGTGAPDFGDPIELLKLRVGLIYGAFTIAVTFLWILCLIAHIYPTATGWVLLLEGIRDAPLVLASLGTFLYAEYNDQTFGFIMLGFVASSTLTFGSVLWAYLKHMGFRRVGRR
ncbi:hypothetical protein TWF694_009272 [Orbilia ellipsospora]|uniref:Uncharacterized protein n=1 Tax=Orbilia ellipsospora TaxID=2528407 RepID=A0AAV9XEH4_9PEZI